MKVKKHTSAAFAARRIAITGILAALSTVLMMLSFNIPVVPSFLKFDLSEMPALLAAFAFGPIEGVLVCLIKNLINLPFTTTGGVGELSNFLLGASFTATAGIIYKIHTDRKGALLASLSGCLAMALLSVPINYFITYPVYTSFLPLEAILGMYNAIIPGMNDLITCLWVFNAPFTFFKGLCDVAIVFLIYKRISPLLRGKESR